MDMSELKTKVDEEKITDEKLSMEEIRERAEKEIKEKKELESASLPQEIVNAQFEINLKEISSNEEFLKVSKEISNRQVYAKLKEEAIKTLSDEQKNELAEYTLKLEKDKLKYRQKHEKKIILEDIKADLQNQRIEALKKRYFYMYESNEPFIPSKFHNIIKEVVNKWESTSVNTKKIVRGVIRILVYGGLAVLVGAVGWRVVTWIISNADKLQNLT